MDRRREFVRLALAPGANRSALCRRFGVSRSNGYKWLGRHAAEGLPGLEERSRRPLSSPRQTPDELVERVLAVRAEHPMWGGRKIRRVLQDAGVAAPAASTITEILRRAGKLGGAGEPRGWVRFEHEAPNDLWQMDFKGHVALAQGRCHPLTVIDDHSRYALEIGACGDERGATVQARLERVFDRYGLPRRLLTDNGPPWGTASAERHTRLTVWLLDLGVGVVHGRPYHPQTQGKDERFHRTLRGEVLDGVTFADLAEAQAAFDAWREVYNGKRPHEAIGLETPARRYRMSPLSMPAAITPPDYEPQAQVRTVQDGGWISFKGRKVKCSKAFVGRRLALRATDTDGLDDLCYRRHILAQLDLRHSTPKTVPNVPEQPYTLSPV